MDFLEKFDIKPKEVLGTGEVVFTDGTNDLFANQPLCEAYGYTYNVATGTCQAFKFNTIVENKFNNINNNTSGGKTENGTKHTILNGQENVTKGNNTNNILNGEKHQIENTIKNSNVLAGSFGNVKNQSEIVIGGGGFGTTLGLAQTSFVQQSGLTTDATQTNLFTQYLTNKFIEKVANAVIGFEANVIGVNYGGEGEVGQYIYLQLRGAVAIGNGFATTYTQSSTTIANGGLSATATMKDATATSFGVAVTGVEETRIQWTADVKLWQNKITQIF
tara:strand:+ start:1441 stop:2268 length:828 start_codon:yes stop_codon:yes gene_type:complete